MAGAADRRDLHAVMIEPSVLFQKTACLVPQQRPCIVLDVRLNKEFKRLHVWSAFNVVVSKNGKILADYSQNRYSEPWSNGLWWDREVILYGGAEEPLTALHPVASFLLSERRARSVMLVSGGFPAIHAAYSFLATASLKSLSRKYPSEIVAGVSPGGFALFLGDWEHASSAEVLSDLSIGRLLTIHNDPASLPVPKATIAHLKLTLADTATEDISGMLDSAADFIAAAAKAGRRCLVHCGAGVSRSASLVIAYLIRERAMTAAEALAHCQARRGNVQPNPGFWAALLNYEQAKGRSRGSAYGSAGALGDGSAAAGAISARGHCLADLLGGGEVLEEEEPEEDAPLEERAARAGLRLEVRKGGELIAVLPLAAGSSLLAGRNQDCGLRLDHGSASRRHAAVRCSIRPSASASNAGGGGLFEVTVEDLGSQHGTFVNGQRQAAGVKTPLKDGDCVRFGESTREYWLRGAGAAEAAAAGWTAAGPAAGSGGGGGGDGLAGVAGEEHRRRREGEDEEEEDAKRGRRQKMER